MANAWLCQDAVGGNWKELNLWLPTLPRSPAPGGGTTHSCQGHWCCRSPQRSLPCGTGLWGRPHLLSGCRCCPVSCRSGSGCPRLWKKTRGTQSPLEPRHGIGVWRGPGRGLWGTGHPFPIA